MASPTVGKAYRLNRRDFRAGVCLPYRGRLVLLGWDDGVLRTHDVAKRYGFSQEPDVGALIDEWGISLEQLDCTVELLCYARHEDVLRVRARDDRRA